jgi:formylglycine-generating enzyme required for sulfatase activity
MFKFLSTLIIIFITVTPSHAEIDPAAPVPVDAKPSKEQIDALVARTKSNLAYLPGSTFMMGDWGDPKSGLPYDYKADSKPSHKVKLDGFSMMKYKVTYAEFDLFTAAKGLPKVNLDEFSLRYRAPGNPAGVNWYGAKAYCQWLAELTKLPFDLPTEAQWEYAARSGGTQVLFPTDNGQLEEGRNFPSYEQRKALGGGRTETIIPIGKFPPNSAGIYGMGELVREWVEDWYDEEYYRYSPVKNPRGPSTGTHKVQRGDHGSSPEFSAMVFMRGDRLPRPMDYNDMPYEGYSSIVDDTFRCAVNKISRVK